MKPTSALRNLFALAGSSLLAVSYAHAATVNWEGDTANNLWATAGNWDTAPANSLLTDIANFNLATYGGNPVWAPTVGTATSINGITIGALNGTMTLTNTAALSIGNSGITIANGAGAFTISGSTTLGASQNWTNNSANLFTFGAVTAGANTLTIGGSGNTTASGNISGTNGALIKEGAGILTLNAANGYTGATTVNGGELRWGVADAIAAGALNINNGGTVNMQGFSDTVGTVTIANGGSITGTSGTLTTGSFISNGGGTMTGTTLQLGSTTAGITYNGGAGSTTLQIDKVTLNTGTSTHEFNIADGDDAVDFDITGAVNNGGGNVSRTIVKTGAGVMQFSGSTLGTAGQNGISLNINQGTVLMNRATGVAFVPGSEFLITVGDGIGTAGSAILKFAATGGNEQLGNRPITINSDGLFDLNGKNETTSSALTVNGGSITTGAGTLSLGNATNTISDAGTVTGNLTLSGTAATNLTLGGTANINGTTTFSGGNGSGITATGNTSIAGTLAFGSNSRTIAVTNASDTLTISANTTGSGAITKNGNGSLVLTGSNGYSGGTTVSAGTLQIGDGTTAGTMASTSALTLGNATFRVLAPASGGSSQTVASLATSLSTGSTIRLTPGASGNTTLTITGTGLSTGAGSSLNFDYSAGTTVGGTVGNNYVVWNPTLTGGIIGGAYTVTDSGGTGFATKNGTNIVRLTDPGGAGLPVSTGSATGSYFIGSGYSTVDTATPGSLVQALSGAVAASNVTVNTTGLASGANLALGTNLLTLGAGIVFDGPNAYEISGNGAGGLRAATSGGTINLYNANTNTVTISAPIVANGASVLTVAGPGTTILSGTNTYTGATVLNGGTVRFSGTMAASPITINNGAVAQIGTATSLTSSNSVTFGAGSTGSLQLLGNNLTIGALSSNATTLGTPVITNNNGGGPVANATLTIDSASSSTFGGVIQEGTGGGTLRLVKSGAGNLTLSGANTYTGGIVVNGGVLALTNAGNAITGGITLNGGALGDAAGAISTATLNHNNITVNGAASLGMATNTSTNGTITLNTGSNLTLGTNGSTFQIFGAVTGDGSISINRLSSGGHSQELNSTSNTFTGTVSFTGGATLALTVNSLADSASLGAGNIRFAVGAGTSAHTFALGSGAIAPLTLNNRRIELVAGSSAAYTIANNSSQAFTINTDLLVGVNSGSPVLTLGGNGTGLSSFNGKIENGSAPSLGFTKSGTGTWLLSGANTYTGTTRISGGTLIINTLKNYNVASSLGAATSGDIIFNRSTSSNLVYVGSGDTTNRTIRHEPDVSGRNNGSGLYNNGTGALIFNGSTFNTPFVESGNAGRTTPFNLGGTYSGDANEIRGVIANNDASSLIAITKNADTSIWQFSGANTYSGGNTISGGTMRGTQTSGTPFGTGAVTINAGILSLAPTGSGSAVSLSGGTVASGTLFTYNAGAALSLARGSQNSLTYTFGGGGNTTARGTNGTLIVSTSDIANFGAAGSRLERFIMNGTAPAQVNTLISGVVIQDRNNGNAGDFAAYDATHGFTKASYTLSNTFTGSTNVSRVEITSATSTGNIASYAIKANATVTNSGTITLGSSGNPAALILNGGSISGGTLAASSGNPEFLIYTSGTSSISSAITSTNTGMSVFGPGSLTLSSSNSFTGGLRVNNSTLIVSNDNQLGGANNALTLRGGTLQTSGASLAIGAGARAIILAVGQDQTGGTFDVTSGTTTFQNNSASARVISGSGSLTKTGAGILELTGNTTNTYTGGSFVNQGTLRLGASNMLADTGLITVNGGTFDLQTSSDTVGAVTLTSGSITGTGGTLTGSSYDVRSGNVSAILGGSAALTKSTVGTVTLSGTNNYAGATTISAGTLQLGNGGTLGSLTGTSSITVSSGANLTINRSDAFSQATDLNNKAITGTGSFTQSGNGTTTLSGTNTYTGATTVSAGALIINGSVTSASVSVASGASLGGSGVLSNATLSGAGSINPGNSPGILTAAATDPTGGLDYNFEMTAAANTLPTWSNATASGNDVLRLTDATTPFAGSLGATNVISLYFGIGITPTVGDVFTGGFYTDKNSDFLSAISSATFQYFVYNGVSGTPYNGTFYDLYTGPSITVSTFQVASADFAGGTVTNGYVTQFTVVPETSTALLSGLGALALLRRRRK